MSFKDNLRKKRNKANISQERLAEEMSVSRQTISKWENGDTYPSTKHIFMLAKILECNINELVSEKPEDIQPANIVFIKPHKNYTRIFTSIVTAFVMIFSFAISSFNAHTDSMNDSKIAVFDKFIDGSLDATVARDGYTEKKIIGYGITAEDGTFYIKCDLYGDGAPCSAIIYFCENDGDYSYECQYLDNPDFIPVGEYHKVG